MIIRFGVIGCKKRDINLKLIADGFLELSDK
jgi:hypothetical protein